MKTNKKLIQGICVIMALAAMVSPLGACSNPAKSTTEVQAPEQAAGPVEGEPAQEQQPVAAAVEGEVVSEPVAEGEPAQEQQPVAAAVEGEVVSEPVAEGEPAQEQQPVAAAAEGEVVSEPVAEGEAPAPDVKTPKCTLTLRPYAGTVYEKNIDAALEYIIKQIPSNGAACDMQACAVLDYLQRKFGLDECFAFRNFVDIDAVDTRKRAVFLTQARLIRPGCRLGDIKIRYEDLGIPQFNPEKENVDMDVFPLMGYSIEEIAVRALNCDIMPGDDKFVLKLMDAALLTNDVPALTRPIYTFMSVVAVMCYQWMKELGCVANMNFPEDTEEVLANRLLTIIEEEGANSKAGSLGIAVLHYIGKGDLVSQECTDALIATQNAEGAWEHREAADCSKTITALWIMLEEALPNVPDIAWVQ